MKRVGMIGGVTWHSSATMYKEINTLVAKELGGLNCAQMVLVNVNLNDIKFAENDEKKGDILADAAKRIEAAGGDCVVIGSNGLHEYADKVAAAVNIPLIHIADSTADEIEKAGYTRVGFIGAKRTMEKDFYTKRLEARGMQVFLPRQEEFDFIDYVVFNETALGTVKPETCAKFYAIAEEMVSRGAQCVILGCTEVGMLMQQEYTDIPLFDTALIHSEAVARFCCEI